MKCEDCQGIGLESENKLCETCKGFGVVGVEEMSSSDINLEKVAPKRVRVYKPKKK